MFRSGLYIPNPNVVCNPPLIPLGAQPFNRLSLTCLSISSILSVTYSSFGTSAAFVPVPVPLPVLEPWPPAFPAGVPFSPASGKFPCAPPLPSGVSVPGVTGVSPLLSPWLGLSVGLTICC